MNVLVSLHDGETASFLAGFLRCAGFEAAVVAQGEPLLATLGGAPAFDAVILEVAARDEGGSLPRLLAGLAGVCVILQTESGTLDSGWAEEGWRPRSILGKPLDLPVLMGVLRDAGLDPGPGSGRGGAVLERTSRGRRQDEPAPGRGTHRTGRIGGRER